MTEPSSWQSGHPRSSLERVHGALLAAGRAPSSAGPGSFTARCPVHEDRHPSLSVTWVSGSRGGATLLNCHGCDALAEDICSALGLSLADLFDEPLPPRSLRPRRSKTQAERQAGKRRGKLGRLPALVPNGAADETGQGEPAHAFVEEQRYAYVDLDGVLVQEVIRETCRSCRTAHKQFRQVFINPAGRTVKTKPAGFQPVLYRAPEVAAGIGNGQTIWLVEGEKDVHTAESVGLVATTNAQGGKAFPEALVPCLAGASVNVVLDRDATGWARGVQLHQMLSAAGCTVRILLPAVTSDKADLSDHIQAGLGVSELLEVQPDEVACWDTLTTVRRACDRVTQACEQAGARWDLAEQGHSRDQNQHYAQRWVLESQIRQGAAKQIHDRLWAAGIQVGTPWAGEAMRRAATLLDAANEQVVAAHRLTQVPLPAAIEAGTHPGQDAPSDYASPHAAPASDDGPAGVVGAGQLGARITSPQFSVINDHIVRYVPGRGADDGSWQVVLNTQMRVVNYEYTFEHPEQDTDAYMTALGRAEPAAHSTQPAHLRKLASVELEYPDPTSGEWLSVRVSAEQWNDHSYLLALPARVRSAAGDGEMVPLDYDSSKSGLERVRRAIKAISTNAQDVEIYRETGWVPDPDHPGKWAYTHARGMITHEGHRNARTDFDGVMRHFNFPDPTEDVDRLKDAWWACSQVMLQVFHPRIIGPTLGLHFRTVLEESNWVVVLAGLRESYKTALASLTMHHWGEGWDRGRQLDTGTGNGATAPAERKILSMARGAVAWIDDFTVDKNLELGLKLLDTLIRSIHNRERRHRLARDGSHIYGGEAPRCSGLLTSEFDPRNESARQRSFIVRINPGDLDLEVIKELDSRESRHGRALLTSSLMMWLAQDRDHFVQHYLRGRDCVLNHYRRTYADHGYGPRQADSAADLTVGWQLMVDFLITRGVISEQEGRATMEQAIQGMIEGLDLASDTDLISGDSELLIAQIAYALNSGHAYLDDADTDHSAPPDDPALARQVGWTQIAVPGSGQRTGMPQMAFEHRGKKLGWVRDSSPRLLICMSQSALTAAIRDAARAAGQPVNSDDRAIIRHLKEAGVLKTESDGKSTVYTRVAALPGRARRFVLYLDKILGDGEEHDQDDDSDDPSQRPGAPQPSAAAEMIAGELPGVPMPLVAPADTPGQSPQLPVTLDEAAPTAPPAPGEADHSPPQSPAGQTGHGPAAVSPTRGRGQARISPAGFAAAAAVVDVDSIYLSNGRTVDMPGNGPRHIGDLHKLAQWLNLGTQVTKTVRAEGQVWVTEALARSLGIDVDAITAAQPFKRKEETKRITADSTAVTEAIADGYHLGGKPSNCLKAWTRVWKDGEKATQVVLIPAIADDSDLAILDDQPEPAQLARRLGLMADALGSPLLVNPATTGLNLMTSMRSLQDRQRMFTAYSPCPPATDNTLEPDCAWMRTPNDEEAGHEWVHFYDRNGSYLPVVSGLNLGVGQPTHYPDGQPFSLTEKRPGYWRIDVPESGDWRMPHPLDPRGTQAGRQWWVTTPSLQLAFELGYELEVHEAWLWDDSARVLDPWYKRLRDARLTLMDTDDPQAAAVLQQLKSVYVSSLGKMSSPQWQGKDEYAPDRYHAVRAKAKANILRRVVQIGTDSGRWPVSVGRDTIAYTSNDPDPAAAWPGEQRWFDPSRRQLGAYKPEKSMLLADFLPTLREHGRPRR